jgi:hypothetical protein
MLLGIRLSRGIVARVVYPAAACLNTLNPLKEFAPFGGFAFFSGQFLSLPFHFLVAQGEGQSFLEFEEPSGGRFFPAGEGFGRSGAAENQFRKLVPRQRRSRSLRISYEHAAGGIKIATLWRLRNGRHRPFAQQNKIFFPDFENGAILKPYVDSIPCLEYNDRAVFIQRKGLASQHRQEYTRRSKSRQAMELMLPYQAGNGIIAALLHRDR